MNSKAHTIVVYVKNGKHPLQAVKFSTEVSGYEPYIDWAGSDLLIMRKKPEGGSGVVLGRFNSYIFFTKHFEK